MKTYRNTVTGAIIHTYGTVSADDLEEVKEKAPKKAPKKSVKKEK